jgi:hypothetical protein
MLQPASVRAASALADKVSTFAARFQSPIGRAISASVKAANLIVALATPTAMIALVLGLWRLAADLGWTGEFFISDGLLSHWQVWILLAAGLKLGVSALAAKTGLDARTPEENKAEF